MGLVGGLRVGQSAGQVLDGFLLRAAGKQLGVVLGLAGLGFGAGFLQAGGLVGDKLHHILWRDGKKDHQPGDKQQDHHKVGGRAAAQRHQACADGAAEHAARPEPGLAPGKQRLHHLHKVGVPNRKAGEHHRHAAAHQRQQQRFGQELAHQIARSHQIGHIQKQRPHKVGQDAEHPEQPAAHQVPGGLPRNDHQRNGQHAQRRHQNAAHNAGAFLPAPGTAGSRLAGTAAAPRSAFAARGAAARAGAAPD